MKAQEIIDKIAEFPRFPSEERLKYIEACLVKLGRPESQVKFVHVTGTNGKGSTCAMLASVMQKAGYRVGLFTSPHLFDWRERIQINGENISDSQLEEHGERIMGFELGIFEAWFLMAMSVFAAKNVDIVILEAGIGGKVDTTNVIPSPEVSVITNVGLDHIDILGDTKEKIALDKAGIVKDSVLVTGIEDAELLRILPKHRAVKVEGNFLKKNEAVALKVLQVLREQGWEIHENAIDEGLASLKWPLRMEVLREHPLVIADGAHNLHAVKAVKAELPAKSSGRRFLLMGIANTKDYKTMAPILAEGMDEVVVSEASFNATGAEKLADFVSNCTIIPELEDAVKWIMGQIQEEDELYIMGSLYLATEAVSAFQESGFLVDHRFNNNQTVTD
jgi:dihydrofolate synthase / folylpolyglutamate synthase